MSHPDDLIQSVAENDSGHFTIENHDGTAMLHVYPAGKKGKPVRPDDVFARLELFGMHDYDVEAVEEAVYSANGRPIPIGAYREPDPIDGSFSIEIDTNGMSVRLLVDPPRFNGQAVTQKEVMQELQNQGIVYGVDEEAIDHILQEATPGFRDDVYYRGKESSGEIAHGSYASQGSNGHVRFYFDPNPGRAPVQESRDPRHVERVDFKNLDVIQTCKAGDLLAEIEEATPGEPGRDVYGEVLPPPSVENARLVPAKNTRGESENRVVRAEIDGQVKADIRKDGREVQIRVDEILRVEKIDYSTGHVEFPGTVLVRGTVLDGFRVQAKGDIVVEKSVGNVRLEAGGDIVLHGGVVSRGDGYIRSDGSIYARFAESATLHAKDSVFVEEAIMHSRVTAGEIVSVDGGRGELIGGQTICGKMLRAKKIGAKVGTTTIISAGIDPETLAKLDELEQDYSNRKETLRKVENHLNILDDARKRGKVLSDKEMETRAGLVRIKQKYASIIADLDRDREKIYASITPDPEAQVVATDAVYPGVEVSFGAGVKRYRVERDARFKYCRFLIEKDEVVLRHSDL